MLINDRGVSERMAIEGVRHRVSFVDRRGPLIREIRPVSVGVRLFLSSFLYPPSPPPTLLFLRSLRRTAGSFFQSMSINLDLGSSPFPLRILFFRRACTAVSSLAKGRRAHNYSSGSLPNSSSLITVLAAFLRST